MFKKLIVISSTLILSISLLSIANAQVSEQSNDTDIVRIYPYTATFTITAYYSPIEGQQRYIKGSLEADKKLNGNGTNGADGTPVFPGMIAAPKNIPFGTKMNIPGIGIVSVHDRGGAIVPAGERGQSFDRLDIWMGSGDEGLNRALNWGRRTVDVLVYGMDSNIIEDIDLSGISTISFPDPNPVSVQLPKLSFGLGDNNAEIQVIKQKMSDLNYFKGKINQDFDLDLYYSIINLQINNQIIDSQKDFGAGYFGPQTRVALEKAILNNSQNTSKLNIINTAKADNSVNTYQNKVALAGNGLNFLDQDLKLGDNGQAVIELQTELRKLNLLGLEPTGYYGEVTAHAVFKFQQSQGILNNKSDFGAGILGPLTREKFKNIVNNRIEVRQIIADNKNKNSLIASN